MPVHCFAPPTSTRNPSPTNAGPMPNLVGYDGFLMPSLIHSSEKTGASATIIAAFTDCHQVEGNSYPKITLRVDSSANTVSVDPACSNTPQNTALPQNRIEITTRR